MLSGMGNRALQWKDIYIPDIWHSDGQTGGTIGNLKLEAPRDFDGGADLDDKLGSQSHIKMPS